MYDFTPFNRDEEDVKVVRREDNKCVVEMDLFRKVREMVKPNLAFHYPRAHLCGYVALPKSEVPASWYERDAERDCPVEVHGGCTYSDVQTEDGREYVIFGFDCAHAFDDEDDDMHDPDIVMAMVRKFESDLIEAVAAHNMGE